MGVMLGFQSSLLMKPRA